LGTKVISRVGRRIEGKRKISARGIQYNNKFCSAGILPHFFYLMYLWLIPFQLSTHILRPKIQISDLNNKRSFWHFISTHAEIFLVFVLQNKNSPTHLFFMSGEKRRTDVHKM
jgi:hypothetical protein